MYSRGKIACTKFIWGKEKGVLIRDMTPHFMGVL